MKTSCEFIVVPLVVAWNDRDERNAQRIEEVMDDRQPVREVGSLRLDYVTAPKQNDGHSCGIHAILLAFHVMRDEIPSPGAPMLTPFAVNVLRLRFMWMIFCTARTLRDTTQEKDAAEAAATFANYADPPQQKTTKSTRGKAKSSARSK
jgi:hypothetical protein